MKKGARCCWFGGYNVYLRWIVLVIAITRLNVCSVAARKFRLRKLLHQHNNNNDAITMEESRAIIEEVVVSSMQRRRKRSGGSFTAEAQNIMQSSTTTMPSSPPSLREKNSSSSSKTFMPTRIIHALDLLLHQNHLEQRLHQIYHHIVQFLHTLYIHLLSILLYKPPVGVVALLYGLRLILTGRLFQWERPEQDPLEVMLQVMQRKKHKWNNKRSFEFDPQDSLYRRTGGVHMVRGRFCEAALREYVHPTTFHDVSRHEEWMCLSNEQQQLVWTVWRTLDLVTHLKSGGGTSIDFLQQLIPALSQIECMLLQKKLDGMNGFFTPNKKKNKSSHLDRLLSLSILTLQLQSMDALLRLCRDQLVQTSYRLARAQEHWNRRIVRRQKRQGTLWPTGIIIVADDLNLLRLRLSHAQAAYQAEIQRLGRVAALILQLPADLNEAWLLQALKASQEERIAAKKQRYKNWYQRVVDVKHWKLVPTMSKYSTGWMGGRWFIRRFDRSERQLSAASATAALLSSDDGGADAWMEPALEWTKQARALLIETVQQTLDGSADSTQSTTDDWNRIQMAWSATTTMTASSSSSEAEEENIQPWQRQQQWFRVLHYVNALSTWRRVGEGKLVRLKDAAIVHWTRSLDIFGIPSYVISIWCAYKFHCWILPYWPRLKTQAVELMLMFLDIWEARVWIPLIGLIDEIMNKSKGMMSALSLETEEMSLDHMLRDMGFGDGSASSRQSALEHAAEQYEHDLRTGVFMNLASGRLIRLLLVQVQQLKVGLLTALDTIDVLMEGNKIHFQIMAFVPAVLLMYYGTRFFLRALYNIRAKDLRPVNVVHSEMALFLDQIESILLQAQGVQDHSASSFTHNFSMPGSNTSSIPSSLWTRRWNMLPELLKQTKRQNYQQRQSKASQSSTSDLSIAQLGELLLFMHRYLVLLDYGSPPFPPRQCDYIHESLQGILLLAVVVAGNNKQNATTTGVTWLHTIQRKHQSLLKSL